MKMTATLFPQILFLFIVSTACSITDFNKDRLFSEYLKESKNLHKIDSINQILYKAYPYQVESLLKSIDTVTLSAKEKGRYYLTQSLLTSKKGDITKSIIYLNRATTVMPSNISEKENAEINLIWGMIFEQQQLHSQASRSYLVSLEYFKNHISEQYFHSLIGLARNQSENKMFMEKAFDYLEKNPDSYLERLYLQTKVRFMRSVKEQHKLLLEVLQKCDNLASTPERIKLYASIALSCFKTGKSDSAIYYIQQATPLIEANNLSNVVLAQFYTAKAFVYIYTNKLDKDSYYKIAEVALDSALIKAKNQPGLLANVFVQRSQLKFKQKNFRNAYLDLKLYVNYINEQKIESNKNQLAILTINYKLHDKEVEITKIRNSRALIVYLLIIVILSSFIVFFLYKQSEYRKKQTMLQLMSLTVKEKEEWRKKFETSELAINNYFLKNHTKLDWDNFRVSFIIKYPEFGERLQNLFNDFKPVDLKYCMCISCGMSNTETAELLGVTPDAVKKAKRKLKIMFDIESVNKLPDYLKSFCNSQGN